MAQLHYVGKNGNALLDAERIENLRLANEIQRAKLQRLGGDVVDRRKVVFMLEHTLILLRTQILTIPALVSSELRDLDNAQAHRVRMCIEDSIHRFLTQLSENMEAAMSSEEFFEKLEASLSEKKDGATAELKRDIAKQRRTQKRHEKAARR